MPKTFGHTKTLFLQNGKYYKWSYKFSHCVECGKCDFKHKGRGLCTSCWDKERAKNPERRDKLKATCKDWHKKNYSPVIEKKKKPKNFTEEDYITYKRKWYQENRPAILLMRKVTRRLSRGLPCMKIIINGNTRHLPFETLEKPKTMTNKGYDQWRKNYEEYDILLKHYQKGTTPH